MSASSERWKTRGPPKQFARCLSPGPRYRGVRLGRRWLACWSLPASVSPRRAACSPIERPGPGTVCRPPLPALGRGPSFHGSWTNVLNSYSALIIAIDMTFTRFVCFALFIVYTFLYHTFKSCPYVLLTMLLLLYVQSDLDQTLIRPAEWPINKRNDDDNLASRSPGTKSQNAVFGALT